MKLADAVTPAEFQTLVERAIDDDRAALAELRRVDVVDGQQVDVAGALQGAGADELEVRLRTLGDSIASVSQSLPIDPRAEAREVLAEARFQADAPRPLRSFFEWLGDLFPDLSDLPGPPAIAWLVLAALVIVIATVVGRRVLTRRIATSAAARAAADAEREDPRTLERLADEAEAAGQFERALRLRFRAGLLRLDEAGAIEYRPSIPTAEVRRKLRSEDFDALAHTFDDVVYGGRAAEDADVEEARSRWRQVVAR
ncbi:MAG TPA: DUF4129 domain-containing protein [Solirubrobacter sp.]|nr:DUF4129 domain-containing protein [Solirubrobacter sp.]